MASLFFKWLICASKALNASPNPAFRFGEACPFRANPKKNEKTRKRFTLTSQSRLILRHHIGHVIHPHAEDLRGADQPAAALSARDAVKAYAAIDQRVDRVF